MRMLTCVDLPGELWAPILGHEGYEVSTLGRVRSFINNRWGMKKEPHSVQPAPDLHGRLHVVLYLKGKGTTCKVHQLVLEAFVGPCPPGMEARHYENNDPSDNRLANLRWGTKRENEEDKRRHGTWPDGEKNPASKLTEAVVAEIRQRLASGEEGKALAREYGMSRASISRINTGKAWCGDG